MTSTSTLEQGESQPGLSAAAYLEIFRSLPVPAILTAQPEGRVADVNAAFLAQFGFTRKEVIGRTTAGLGVFIAPGQRETLIQAFRHDGLRSVETDLGLRSGMVAPFLISIQELQIEGKPYFLMTLQPIERQRQLQNTLDETAIKFRAVFENSRDAIGVSKAGIHQYSNPAYLQLFGYSSDDELRGQPLLEVIAPSHRDQMREIVRLRSARKDAPHLYETRGLHKDGTEFDAEVQSSTFVLHGELYTIGLLRDITERKRAEQALRESEAGLQSILANLLDAYFQADLSGRFIRVSQSAPKMFGYDFPHEMIGLSAEKMYANAEDRETMLADLRASGHIMDWVGVARRKDGSTFWVSMNVQFRRDADGQIVGTEGVVRDITERVRAEQALRLSEQNFRSLVENSPSAKAVLNRDGQIKYANPTGIRIWNDPNIIGKTIFDIFPAEYAARYSAAIRQVIDTRTALQDEVDSLINGKPMCFQLSMEPLSDPDGNVTTLLLNAWDITERKTAERALQESEERFRQAFETSPDAISISRLDDGKYILVNPGVAEIFGYAPEEVLGKTAADLGLWPYPEDRQRILEAIQRDGIVREMEVQARRKDGTILDVALSAARLEIDGVPHLLGIVRDITERKSAEQAVREREALLRGFLEQSRDAIMITDEHGVIIEWSPSASALTGYSREESVGRYLWDVQARSAPAEMRSPGLSESIRQFMQRALTTNTGPILNQPAEDAKIQRPDGSRLSVQTVVFSIPTDKGFRLGAVLRNVTERKEAEEALRESEEKFKYVFDHSVVGKTITFPDGRITANHAFCEMLGYSVDELNDGRWQSITHPEDIELSEREIARLRSGETDTVRFVKRYIHKNGSIVWVDLGSAVRRDDDGKPLYFMTSVLDITERKQNEDAVRRLNRELRAISDCNTALVRADDESTLLQEICRIICEEAGYLMCWVGYVEHDEQKTVRPVAWAGKNDGYLDSAQVVWSDTPRGHGPGGTAIRTGQTVYAEVLEDDPSIAPWREQALQRGYRSIISLPLKDEHDQPFGLLSMYAAERNAFTPAEQQLLEQLASDLAFGMSVLRTRTERERTERKLQRQLQTVRTLREIDQAISSSVGLDISLGTVLSHAQNELPVDAACILLLDPYMQTLSYAARRGFRTELFRRAAPFGLTRSYAGRAILERCRIDVPDVAAEPSNPNFEAALSAEGFVSYYCLPLISKGVVHGVMEVFHRSRLSPNDEWLTLLDALAGQAAIAIDNATMFERLESSNRELASAYEATIEGWSKAMDLRDKETEGHTQRVAETTITLAAAFGVRDAELRDIRRGALLHDIGKLGVPDHILLKPGPLTDEEWILMRQHPQFAYNMLAPIRYLHSALNIPYCHHEKWDGTGYPRGLAGEQIPLEARLFAVVDVWDALTSDRPYRAAWTREKALEYIAAQAGSHFDPHVVAKFMDLARSGLVVRVA